MALAKGSIDSTDLAACMEFRATRPATIGWRGSRLEPPPPNAQAPRLRGPPRYLAASGDLCLGSSAEISLTHNS